MHLELWLVCEGDSRFVPGLRAQCASGGSVAASSEAPQNKMHNTLKEDADNGALSKQTQSWKLSHNIKPHLSAIFVPDCPSVRLVLTFAVQVRFIFFFTPSPPTSITNRDCQTRLIPQIANWGSASHQQGSSSSSLSNAARSKTSSRSQPLVRSES